ncbi:MAG: tetratricopeptide repeat protein, partial [Tepidisphaeraceae bacterium]
RIETVRSFAIQCRVVSPPDHIDPGEFVSTVQPLLERRDLQSLYALLKGRWTAAQIVSLLSCRCCDARKVAALCLSLVGQSCCIPELAMRLCDSDPMVNQMAEHAMWSIWFRGGCPKANHELIRGAKAMERRDHEHAITHFDSAIEFSADFSEAYNQRAIARFLLERFKESLTDCRMVLELEPRHFGAWAGMGHNHAHLGDTKEAIRCYEQALSINPHMTGIEAAVKELRDHCA